MPKPADHPANMQITLASMTTASLDEILTTDHVSWGVKGLCAYLHNEGQPVSYSTIKGWGSGSGHDEDSWTVVRDALAHGFAVAK